MPDFEAAVCQPMRVCLQLMQVSCEECVCVAALGCGLRSRTDAAIMHLQ